jgi:TonB family protein
MTVRQSRITLLTAVVFVLCFVCFGTAVAQLSSTPETPQSDVVLAKLSPPTYPPLARQARISGEVRVEVAIRKDGTVESASALDGPAMLKDSALESARKSLFECRKCPESLTTHLLTFSFELKDNGDCCNAPSRPTDVSYSQSHIVVVAPPQCICDPSETLRRFRSAKCLYLWKCAKAEVQ